MGKRRVYFQSGEIVEATKRKRKQFIELNKDNNGKIIPYNFSKGFSKEKIDEFWETQLDR